MDEPQELNLCGAMVGVSVLAAIVTLLETHGSLLITNAAIPNAGLGRGAMELGRYLQKVGYFDQSDKEVDGD